MSEAAPRTRSRAALAAQTATPAPTPSGPTDTSWMNTDMSAMDRAFNEEARRREQAEVERKERIGKPYRYWIAAKGPGKNGQYNTGEGHAIVVDRNLGPVFEEHEYYNPTTNETKQETCPGRWEYCPICDVGVGDVHHWKRAYPVMFLTVIDLREVHFTKGDLAGESVPWTRKLLPVKQDHYGFFKRQFERYGTLRGLHLIMTRPTNKTIRTGQPEFDEIIPEAELQAEFGQAIVSPRTNKVLRPAGEDLIPFDYGRLFPKPSGAALVAKLGFGTLPAGSVQDNSRGWGTPPGQPDPTPVTPNDGGSDGGATGFNPEASPTPVDTPAPRGSRFRSAAAAAAVTDPDEVPI